MSSKLNQSLTRSFLDDPISHIPCHKISEARLDQSRLANAYIRFPVHEQRGGGRGREEALVLFSRTSAKVLSVQGNRKAGRLKERRGKRERDETKEERIAENEVVKKEKADSAG